MRPLATDAAWSVRLLDTTLSPAKTAKQIEITFGLWTRVGQKNMYYVRGADPPREGAPIEMHRLCNRAVVGGPAGLAMA